MKDSKNLCLYSVEHDAGLQAVHVEGKPDLSPLSAARKFIANNWKHMSISRAVYANAASGTHLSTGYRINWAMDDAGFQIATRLAAQSSRMTMAMRNIQNGISLMQVADTVSGSLVGWLQDETSAQADSMHRTTSQRCSPTRRPRPVASWAPISPRKWLYRVERRC